MLTNICKKVTSFFLKKICEHDSKYLEYVDAEFIDEELIQNVGKNFDIERVKESKGLLSSKIAMKYFCSINGELLEFVDPSILDSELVEIALRKGFSIEEVEDTFDKERFLDILKDTIEKNPEFIRDINFIQLGITRIRELYKKGLIKSSDLISQKYGKYREILIKDKEFIKELCKLDGIFIIFADKEIIDEEILNISTSKENPNPINAKFFKNHSYIIRELKESKVALEYICRFYGDILIEADDKLIDEKMLDIAIKEGYLSITSFKGKRVGINVMKYLCKIDANWIINANCSFYDDEELFDIVNSQLDISELFNESILKKLCDDRRISLATNITKSKLFMEYLCKKNGKMIKYIYPPLITDELLQNAINNEDPSKRIELDEIIKLPFLKEVDYEKK